MKDSFNYMLKRQNKKKLQDNISETITVSAITMTTTIQMSIRYNLLTKLAV